MGQTIDIDELLIALSGKKLSGWVGVPDLLRPAAKEDRYASVLRAVCCAWCRVFQDRLVDYPDSLKALSLIEEFCRGNAPGDSLSIALRLAKKSARQLARRAGKTKE